MKKLAILWAKVVVFGLCMAISLSLNVYAQQAGPQNNRMMAERKALEQRRQLPQQKIRTYHRQEWQLHPIMGGGGNNRKGNLHHPRIINRNLFSRNL